MSKTFTLGKNERLKSRKAIEALFKEGKRFSVPLFRVCCKLMPAVEGEEHLQFGVTVSTKNFKRAVDRNRIKRLTREAWRVQKNELKQKLKEQSRQMHVFFIYTEKEMTDHTLIFEKVHVAIGKLMKSV